jgi:hypothetical protein
LRHRAIFESDGRPPHGGRLRREGARTDAKKEAWTGASYAGMVFSSDDSIAAAPNSGAKYEVLEANRELVEKALVGHVVIRETFELGAA